MAAGMEGCSLVYNVAGINTLCVDDPEPMLKTNIAGPPVVVRAAVRAGVGRIVHTSSAATIGEASGVVGREDTPHRGWYLSTYERSKTEGEQAVFEAGRQHGVEVVCVNPSSVQGPGRSGGTARFLLAYLDGRWREVRVRFEDQETAALLRGQRRYHAGRETGCETATKSPYELFGSASRARTYALVSGPTRAASSR